MTFNQQFPEWLESKLLSCAGYWAGLGLAGCFGVLGLSQYGNPNFKIVTNLGGLSCTGFAAYCYYKEKIADENLGILQVARREGKQKQAIAEYAPVAVVELVGNAIAPDFYNWDDIDDEAVGFIIAGNSGSAKTSCACWLAGHLTRKNPAQVLALDPHASRNPIWKEVGIPVIDTFKGIEEQVGLLINLLDKRRGQPENGDEVIVFADELGACLDEFSDPRQMEKALKRLGSEARKFGITFLALNQSKNVDDIGISGALRSNYVLVLLGAAARQHAQMWKDEDPRKVHINSCAYPCVLTGAIPDAIAIHPTHGSYSQFKKKGLAPKNLKPIQSLPLTIDLARGYQHLKDVPRGHYEALGDPFAHTLDGIPVCEVREEDFLPSLPSVPAEEIDAD